MKTIAELNTAIAGTRGLPVDIVDFHKTQSLREGTVSSGGKALLTYFKPYLEQANWTDGNFGMTPAARKASKEAAQLAAAHAMLNRLRMGKKALAYEATTAGVDLPTFTRQLLITISRAYAQLFTLQLFGILPLTQPTGRLHFKDYQYDQNFNGTVANPTPTISQGDRIDDITKFNPDFYKIAEGQFANKVKIHYSNLDISVSDYRVIAEWTDQLADDAMAVYDTDAEQALMDQMAQEMARVVDRTMIAAVLNNVPSANTYTWTQQPNGSNGTINYSTADMANRREYDQTLVSDGIMTTLNKIRITRKYSQDDAYPNWAVCGTNFSLALMKAQSFRPVDKGIEMQVQTGALRDLGDLTTMGIRFMVDVMLDSNTCIFGRKPTAKNDPGIYWAPYVNLQPTRDLYDPETGTTTRGVRSRFAVAQPNTGVNPASSQLADIYGKLTIV